MKLSTRKLELTDLKDVFRIEKASFPNAWTVSQFVQTYNLGSVDSFVVESEEATCGFFMLERTRSRMHVLNLAVAPDKRRQGVGTFILGQIESIAGAEGRRRIELEVRETNLAGQLLYRKSGYRAVRILRGHYGNEDAYLMRRDSRRSSGPGLPAACGPESR